MSAKIHPTALVDRGARLGAGVVVGPHAVIEADVSIGDGCEIMAGAVIRRYTSMGDGNVVHPFAVLGGVPQDYKFDADSVTGLQIGSGNVFRESVTLNRATAPGGATVIGSGCFFMANSHAGHDSRVGDGVVLTNSVVLGGHCEVGPRAVLSANAMVHQFCWVGELVMMRGCAGAAQHIPPFVICRDIDNVVGLNSVGLRRAEDITRQDADQIKQAYRLLYRSSLTSTEALEEMGSHDEWGPAASRFRDFVRRALSAEPPYNRGLSASRPGWRRW